MNRERPGRHDCMRIPRLPQAGPRRVYGVVTLVNTFGFGLIVTSMVLYFTRVMHLSSDEVGLGMTIAGLVGLLAGVPMGDLADRYGPRVVVRATFLMSFLTAVGFLLIRDFAAFGRSPRSTCWR
jgi:predicted MFS family arabinose efflux permease